MHTFFINTSKGVNVARHEKLFDSLGAQNLIKVFNYGLDKLNACADEISKIITRNDNIAEIYNIIVYVEISERNELALAAEKVASLQVEEMLFSRLYALGRKPGKSLILFGENFTRNAEYGIGNEYQKNVKNALWNMFPLPQLDMAKDILKNIKKKYPVVNKDNLIRYRHDVWSSLTEDFSENSLLHSDNDFVVSTIYEMAESVQNDNIDDVDLLKELYDALINQKQHVQLQVTTEKVLYAHVRLMDSDFNAKNRTEYRILLYVYYCAVTDDIKLCKADVESVEELDVGIVLGADTIPDIDWKIFSTGLKEKREIFDRELKQLDLYDEKFPTFNSSFLSDRVIVALSSETPRLITEIKAHSGLTVSQLREAVNSTIDEIEVKNDENEKTIIGFITKVTDNFSASKDKLMKSVRYKNDEDFIESIKLVDDFIKTETDKADSRIASHKRLSMNTTHIDDYIKEARIKIEYYFECLKKASLLYIIAAVFTVLFALPYALIQRNVFSVIHGWLFYVISVAVVISAYFVGYSVFDRVYKSRIVKELGFLCDRFAETQKEKQECLEDYATLIRSDIPLSFCLTLYGNEFKEYVLRRELTPEYITYHKRILDDYINYVNNLLNELDIYDLGDEPEITDEYIPVITVCDDKYKNNTVYTLVDNINIEDYYFFNNEGGN